MYPRYLLALASATIIAISASAAGAITLTFDGVPGGVGCPPNPTSITEGGFTISNCPEAFIEPGEIHLDDSGTSFQSAVDFSAGTRFNAISVLIQGLGTSFFDAVANEPVPYDNVLFEGFRDGALVASQGYSTFPLSALQLDTVLFGSDFVALELLRITQVLPGPSDFILFPNASCDDAPCAHVSLKEITLTQVPLPSALPIFLGALAAAGFVGWRSRRETS